MFGAPAPDSVRAGRHRPGRGGLGGLTAGGAFNITSGVFAFAKGWGDVGTASTAAPASVPPPSRSGASVALQDVCLSLKATTGTVEILREATLEVQAGEFV